MHYLKNYLHLHHSQHQSILQAIFGASIHVFWWPSFVSLSFQIVIKMLLMFYQQSRFLSDIFISFSFFSYIGITLSSLLLQTFLISSIILHFSKISSNCICLLSFLVNVHVSRPNSKVGIAIVLKKNHSCIPKSSSYSAIDLMKYMRHILYKVLKNCLSNKYLTFII